MGFRFSRVCAGRVAFGGFFAVFFLCFFIAAGVHAAPVLYAESGKKGWDAPPPEVVPPSMPKVDERVVLRLEAAFHKLKSLTATFTQQSDISSAGISRKENAKGEFFLKAGGKIKWVYSEPEEQILLVSGGMMRFYTPLDKQVLVRKVSGLNDTASYLTILMDEKESLLNYYRLDNVLDRGEVLEATLFPINQQENIDSLVLLIRKSDNLLSGLRFSDSLENLTDITFSAIETNKELPDSVFFLKIPEGTETVNVDNQ